MPLQDLVVGEDRRTLVQAGGTPFFYLGDTAWELFHRLDRAETEHYLQDRAAKGFTVIQAVALAEFDGLSEPNRYGHTPLHENDPARPNEEYFAHVDWVVGRAAEIGLYIGLLPTWGDKWHQRWGIGPVIFTRENAGIYGEWLGRRYRDSSVIWILGGDRVPEAPEHVEVIRAMAEGVRRGDGGRHLVTFHPMGQHSSGAYFHNEKWLDFNMLQSGHTRDRDNYRSVAEDYARTPAKPCMDAEPGYEDHPIAFKAENGYLDSDDVRKFAYWALMAGACGHTYGCHDIWQFLDPERHPPVTAACTAWREALDLPGARQMGYVRQLALSRPFQQRLPDQSLIASDPGNGGAHIGALRGAGGDYAMVYIPDGRPVALNLSQLAPGSIVGHWFDPRSGAWQAISRVERTASTGFTPPSQGYGQDWVLVLDVE
jgi:hypothetical protein